MKKRKAGDIMEMIPIKREDLHRSLFWDVVFIMFAEPCAMICGGDFRFITRDGKFYGFNYLQDDIELKHIRELFPDFRDFCFGAFGKNTRLPMGWKYLYLGVGRHLAVEESVWPEFEEQLLDCQNAFEVAANWWHCALRILNYD
jgi:hypothetical protein